MTSDFNTLLATVHDFRRERSISGIFHLRCPDRGSQRVTETTDEGGPHGTIKSAPCKCSVP